MATRRLASIGHVTLAVAVLAGVIIVGIFGLTTVLFVLFG